MVGTCVTPCLPPLHPMVVGTLNCNILVGGEMGGETGGETGSETGGLVVGTYVTPCLPPPFTPW